MPADRDGRNTLPAAEPEKGSAREEWGRGLPSDVPARGAVIGGKYEVERLLGAGGMGVVVAARHRLLGQYVAIKLMRTDAAHDQNAVERFVREARAAVALSSEHVARVIDVAMLETGAPYIVMEYLAGVDLGQVVKRDGPMPLEAAVGFILQACEALAEAHRMGIVHRDLKPANLFLTNRLDHSPLIKVLDFGISKAAEFGGTDGSQGLTASGIIMGSPNYMSPEQVRSARAVDARSDIWSLGVILYELLTGVSPFQGETLGDTFAKITSESPRPIREYRPDVSPGLEAIIRQCLDRSLAARVQTVGELAAKLLPFAPKDGSLLVKRVLQASDHAGGSTIAAPQVKPLVDPTAPSETEKPWLRSGPSASQVRGKPWLPIAVGAGLVVVAVGLSARYPGHAKTTLPPSTENRVAPVLETKGTSEVSVVAPAAPSIAPSVSTASPLGVTSSAASPSEMHAMPTPRPSTSPVESLPVATGKPRPPHPSVTAGVPLAPRASGAGPAPPVPTLDRPTQGSAEPSTCSPPYVIDSAGHRKYKPECL